MLYAAFHQGTSARLLVGWPPPASPPNSSLCVRASKFGLEGWMDRFTPRLAPRCGINTRSSTRGSSARSCSQSNLTNSPRPSITDYASVEEQLEFWKAQNVSTAGEPGQAPRGASHASRAQSLRHAASFRIAGATQSVGGGRRSRV